MALTWGMRVVQVLFTRGELAGRNFHYHFVVDRGMPYEVETLHWHAQALSHHHCCLSSNMVFRWDDDEVITMGHCCHVSFPKPAQTCQAQSCPLCMPATLVLVIMGCCRRSHQQQAAVLPLKGTFLRSEPLNQVSWVDAAHGGHSRVTHMQEALRRYKEEVAADPDTSSGFFTNTNAANDTKQYVLVGRHP